MTIRPITGKPFEIALLEREIDCEIHGSLNGVTVSGLSLDSRSVKNGDLYVALPGALTHGIEFLDQALSGGARAVWTDPAGFEKIAERTNELTVPVLVSPENPRGLLGKVSALIYQTEEIEMKLFGITGTNGKTSVIYLLETFLRLAGLKTAISTTAERRIGDTAIESGLTSPEAPELHGLLARMIEEEVAAVGIEVSAQAVVRNRIDGVIFDVVAFNNLSQDHLDDFGDMENYYRAKLGLFTPEHAKTGVIVVDSKEGQRLAKESKIPVTTLATEYGQEADWHLAITNHNIDGVSFVLQGPEDTYFRARLPLFGTFMAENAAVALIMLHSAGISIEELYQKTKKEVIPLQIPGRLEQIESSAGGPRFYVDYGHTPGSFEAMLDAVSDVQTGRVIFMFGADGDRDASKREDMGRIAAEGSDILIVCDYHPRYEDPAQIRKQLLVGAAQAKNPAEVHEIPDPQEAIRFAITKADKDDIIIYAGPGHETYMEVAGQMIPYSAREEVRKALKEAGY